MFRLALNMTFQDRHFHYSNDDFRTKVVRLMTRKKAEAQKAERLK